MKVYNKINEKLKKNILKEYGESFTFTHHTGGMFGIGCLVNDSESVDKINRLKERSGSKGYIVLVPELSDREETYSQYFASLGLKITAKQSFLMEQYWPGNLTICLELDADNAINNELENVAIGGKVAVRSPHDPKLRAFIKLFATPVISTSINKSGEEPYNDLNSIAALKWSDFAILDKSKKDYTKRIPAFSTLIDFKGDDILCLREGSIPFEGVKISYESPLISFICTANICRSPMAEYYAKHIFRQRGIPFRVSSGGVFASNNPISSNSELALKEDEIESGHHISQRVTYRLIQDSYLVLTMEEVHKNILCNQFPDMKYKIYTLAEYCGEQQDVIDPYTQGKDVYQDTYTLIKSYIDVLAAKIEKKLGN